MQPYGNSSFLHWKGVSTVRFLMAERTAAQHCDILAGHPLSTVIHWRRQQLSKGSHWQDVL